MRVDEDRMKRLGLLQEPAQTHIKTNSVLMKTHKDLSKDFKWSSSPLLGASGANVQVLIIAT